MADADEVGLDDRSDDRRRAPSDSGCRFEFDFRGQDPSGNQTTVRCRVWMRSGSEENARRRLIAHFGDIGYRVRSIILASREACSVSESEDGVIE